MAVYLLTPALKGEYRYCIVVESDSGVPTIARNTKTQRVIYKSDPLFVGKTAQSAFQSELRRVMEKYPDAIRVVRGKIVKQGEGE